jgi:hypothetical protein
MKISSVILKLRLVVVSVQSLSDKDITRFDDGNETGVNNENTISNLTPISD